MAHSRLVCFPLVVKRHLTLSTESPFVKNKVGIENKAGFSEAKINMGLKLNDFQVESSLVMMEKLIHSLNT